MSTKTSKKTTSQTTTKNGKTVKTQTIIETSTDSSGKTTVKTTVTETITNKDGSTSTTTKTSTKITNSSTETPKSAIKTSKNKKAIQTLQQTTKIESNSDDFFEKEFEMMKQKMESNARKTKTEKPKEKPRILLENNEKKNSVEFSKITNEFRKKNGKPPLKLIDSISEIAKEHNDLMLAGKRGLGHEGFHERSKRIKNSVATAENVGYCGEQPDPLNVLFNALANHPPHRVNILGDYNSIGISVAKNTKGQWFVTQLFASLK